MLTSSPSKAAEFFSAKVEFTLGPVELHHLMESDEQFRIIDVRAREDYEEEHIPGAISLPQESWDQFDKLSHDQTNIVYCYSVVCHLAAKAAKRFAEHDYPVMELDGGFAEWKNHGFDTET